MKKLTILIITIIALVSAGKAQTNLKGVDFTNFTFVIEKTKVKMKDGLQENACTKKDADGIPDGDIWSLEKESIAYGDLDGDGNEEAIISMIANVCGGNMVTNEAVLVYTMSKGKPLQLPTFDYYDEGCKAGEKDCNFSRNGGVLARYDGKEKAIIIETSFVTEADALCCPSFYRETWYKWDGSNFVEAKKGKILKREKSEGN